VGKGVERGGGGRKGKGWGVEEEKKRGEKGKEDG